jgi:hypothetical protein
MRRSNSAVVVVVFASALVLTAGLASAELLDQSLRSSNDIAHQASEQPGTLVAAETEKKTDPAPSGDVQERGIVRPMPGGRIPGETLKPVSPPTPIRCAGGICYCSSENDCLKLEKSGLCITEIRLGACQMKQ